MGGVVTDRLFDVPVDYFVMVEQAIDKLIGLADRFDRFVVQMRKDLLLLEAELDELAEPFPG